MRGRMTPAEGMLWNRLSHGFNGVWFRRQYPIGNHVVDFYCRKLKLIVEISRTAGLKQKEHNASRSDAYLHACGYTVLRFSEKDIIDDISHVNSRIGLRVRFIRFQMQMSSVKGIFGQALDFLQSFFSQKRQCMIA
jgi:very-short-patch-repair endonuclease